MQGGVSCKSECMEGCVSVGACMYVCVHMQVSVCMCAHGSECVGGECVYVCFHAAKKSREEYPPPSK